MIAMNESNTERWQAIAGRDRAMDGRFVYAVITTGVFCRPSCGARLPKPQNVRYFESCAAAEAGGFRACLRCRPAGVPSDVAAVRKALDYLDERFDDRVTLHMLAEHVGCSSFHLQRTFKKYVGVSPKTYVATRRAELLKKRLRDGGTVTAAAIDAGFPSDKTAYAHAGQALGMSPAAYRRRGSGETIGYALGDSSLGRLLVAATARGLAAVSFGDTDATLESDLRREFPAAELLRADCTGAALTAEIRATLGAAQTLVRARIAGSDDETDVPLDPRGSAFQREVWDALRRIAPGETVSYTSLARTLGRPSASRAVARACATNKLAVVIPCHRVIRADGSPSGYRWGVQRKLTLLERERAASRR